MVTPFHYPPLIVRPRAVQAVTGVSKSQVLHLEKVDAKFPKRVRVSDRVTGWLFYELSDYLASLPRI
jgi:predicted DNA-binding transcriptional regulator AlpA